MPQIHHYNQVSTTRFSQADLRGMEVFGTVDFRTAGVKRSFDGFPIRLGPRFCTWEAD